MSHVSPTEGFGHRVYIIVVTQFRPHDNSFGRLQLYNFAQLCNLEGYDKSILEQHSWQFRNQNTMSSFQRCVLLAFDSVNLSAF